MIERERLLELQEVADQLNVHYNTVYRLVKAGSLPATKVGGKWRVDPAAVEEYLRRNKSTPSQSTKAPRIYAVVNQKGGVGKSTITINLSEALVALGRKVLIIDADPQGNSSIGLNVDAEKLPATMAEVMLDNFPIEEAIVKTPFGIDIVPAEIGLSGTELELVARMSRETVLKMALARAKAVLDSYDFIFIDCPPSLGVMAVNALAAAESCLVPIAVGKFSVEGVKLLFRTISEIRQKLNPDLQVGPFVVTQVDLRTNLGNEFVAHIRKSIPYPVAKSVIKTHVRFGEAQFDRKPIGHYDPKGEGHKMFLELAEEILRGVTNGQTA